MPPASTWEGDGEHGSLMTSAEALLATLQGLEARFQIGEVHNYIHTEFASRAALLSLNLRAAVSLARADLYPPALAVLRSCLEQVLVDSLVFLGRRYHQRLLNVSEEKWEAWQRERAAGADWTSSVVDWERNPRNGNVRIVREGLRYSSDGQQSLSIFYFLLDQYVPWMGPPDVQALVEDGLVDLESRKKTAEENRAIYSQYLAWPAIKRNLLENSLATVSEIAQLDVHYRFLSAFVHPIAHVTASLYGRNDTWPKYDHYASELILLYVNTLAVRELRAFEAMAAQPPVLGLRDWQDVHALTETAEALSSHLWPPGGRPHAYDRWRVANERGFAALVSGEGTSTFLSPDELEDPDVTYYSDPLSRLVRLHQTVVEATTGFAYVSPWPRDDARFR